MQPSSHMALLLSATHCVCNANQAISPTLRSSGMLIPERSRVGLCQCTVMTKTMLMNVSTEIDVDTYMLLKHCQKWITM